MVGQGLVEGRIFLGSDMSEAAVSSFTWKSLIS